MQPGDDDPDGNPRRVFLRSGAQILSVAWIAAHWPAIGAAHGHADLSGDDAPRAFEFFNAAQAADVEAIAAQIVPGGTTPGAREARAVYFIDRSLATYFANLAPEYALGLAEFQSRVRAAQIAFLQTVDHEPFFETTRMLTVLGMFTSPKYGGNYQGSGWKLLGFVDQHVFAPPFGYYDREYTGFVPAPKKI
jgi:gluconate 2-dehydrogenase gamma chain